MEKMGLKTAALGQTGLEITRVGFGAWAIGGGGYDWGWGSQDDEDSVAAIHHALALGVNWIDTAAQYGFGHSEAVVGRALANLELSGEDLATIEGGPDMASTANNIGFVGLGHMGGNMATRFLAAGYPVYGEERSREHAQRLVEQGLRWCDTAREVAEAADVVFTSLPDDRVLEEVASGPDGILAGLTTGKTWIDLSTVSPRVSRELAGRVRQRGAAMLDAPVSGSVPQVQSGTLTIMVGGDEDTYRRVEPILRELGTPTYVGENGQGLVLKLAINVSLAVQMLAFAEGLLLADRDGVDRRVALDVMTQSSIGSPMLRARAPLVLDLPEDAWFDIELMHKDIRLALSVAGDLDVPLASADAAEKALSRAEELGYGRRDLAALFQVLEEPPSRSGSDRTG
jgi:3-hydroxyisobutyrate dehydrogenase-like beta-hydroxyacid dehydrogenase